jgi:hypothetical protein
MSVRVISQPMVARSPEISVLVELVGSVSLMVVRQDPTKVTSVLAFERGLLVIAVALYGE